MEPVESPAEPLLQTPALSSSARATRKLSKPLSPVHEEVCAVFGPEDAPELSTYGGEAERPKGGLEVSSDEDELEEITLEEVARLLSKERSKRRADVASLQGEINLQQNLIAQVAESLLTGSVQNSLRSLRENVSALQRQLEVQASALREGLMDVRQQRTEIQQQRAAFVALAGRFDQSGLPPPGGRATSDDAGGVPKEELQEAVAQEVEARLKASDGQRSEEMAVLFEQSCAAHRRDLLALRQDLAAATKGKVQAAELTEELACMASRNEQECTELVHAMELERAARVSEASELRTMVRDVGSAAAPEVEELLLRQRRFEERVDTEFKQHVAGAECREARVQEELSSCAQLGRSTAERLAKLRLPELQEDDAQDENSRAKARIESMIGNAIGHAEQLERRLAAATSEAGDPAAANQDDTARLAEEVRAARADLRQLAGEVERFRSGGAGGGGGNQSSVVDAESPVLVDGAEAKATQQEPQQHERLPRNEKTREGDFLSVPVALHGLVEAAYPLGAGAGRRKALIVACSYFSSHAPLSGPLNDAWNVLSLLRHTLQYKEEQVRFIVDGSERFAASRYPPTEGGILEGLRWLVADVQPGDDLLFYFSGYGTQLPASAPDGRCESYLVPSDFAEDVPPGVREKLGAGAGAASGAAAPPASAVSQHGGYRLVPLWEVTKACASLPKDCKLTLVLDCCHSILPGLGADIEAAPLEVPKTDSQPEITAYQNGRTPAKSRCLQLPPLPQGPRGAAPASTQQPPQIEAAVRCFAACGPRQRCAELQIEGVVQGVLTWSWAKAVVEGHCDPSLARLRGAIEANVEDLRRDHQELDQTPMVVLSPSARAHEEAPLTATAGPTLLAGPGEWTVARSSQRRRALLIGINYSGSPAKLKGCVNDAWHVNCMLRHTLNFAEDQVRVLVDGGGSQPSEPDRAPTKENILAGLQWLIDGAGSGDCLMLVFCGFGAQHPCSPGSDEHEAYLVPSDFAEDLPVGPNFCLRGNTSTPSPTASPVASAAGYRLVSLLEINRVIGELPAGVALTMVLDCSYPVVPGLSPNHNLPVSFPKVKRGRVDYAKLHDFVSRPRFLELPSLPVAHTPLRFEGAAAFPDCAVYCFSSCRLQEWDSELPLEGTVQGTFTWAFIKALAAGRFQSSVGQLHRQIAKITADLRQHFSGVEQTPVLMLSQSASDEDCVLGLH